MFHGSDIEVSVVCFRVQIFRYQCGVFQGSDIDSEVFVVCFRYNVKDLLQLDFFLEETGIKVDVVSSTTGGEEAKPVQPGGGIIQLQLRVIDAKKRKPQHKENEAIQFDYNIDKDNPEDVSQEMVGTWVSLRKWWVLGWLLGNGGYQGVS